MSGFPVNSKLDQARFRKQYLDTLALQIKNNDLNYNANKLYKKTGLPQQPTDERSQEEKYRDIQGLKQSLYSQLLTLMDGSNAEAVLNQLNDNDIIFLGNAFPKLYKDLKPTYALGVPSYIFVDYLNRYGKAQSRNMGLEDGTLQDKQASNIQLILQKMIGQAEVQQLAEDIKNLNLTSYSTLKNEILTELQKVKKQIPSREEISNILKVNSDVSKEEITNILMEAIADLPTKDQLKNQYDELLDAVRQQDPDDIYRMLKIILDSVTSIDRGLGGEFDEIKDMIENQSLETSEQTTELKKQINSSQNEILTQMDINNTGIQEEFDYQNGFIRKMLTKDDLKGIEDEILGDKTGSSGLRNSVLREINDLGNELFSAQQLNEIAFNNFSVDTQDALNVLFNAVENELPTITQLDDVIVHLNEATAQRDRDMADGILKELGQRISDIADITRSDLQDIKQIIETNQNELRMTISNKPVFKSYDELSSTNNTNTDLFYYFRQLLLIPEVKTIMLQKLNKGDWTGGKKRQIVLDNYKEIEDQVRDFTLPPSMATANPITNYMMAEVEPLQQQEQPKEGKGFKMRGRGLCNKKRPSNCLTFQDIDYKKGVSVKPRFIPLGKYIINKKRLDDNVVSVKTRMGGQLANFKSTRVSSKLGNVIRTILGNGIPSYNEIDDLDKDEKEYLYKLAKSSDILDRLNIPAPNRKEQEKEINEFEIMRGEIMSGNDNIQLIKKFKISLLKLIKKGLIPKSQSNEILLELISLGY